MSHLVKRNEEQTGDQCDHDHGEGEALGVFVGVVRAFIIWEYMILLRLARAV